MQLISLSEAARKFPQRNGRHPHIVSIRRRILHGSRGVKLRAVRDGRDWFTCQEWIQEFMEACTRQSMPEAKADARMTAWANEQSKRRLKERYGFDVNPNAAAYLAELEAEVSAESEVLDLRAGVGEPGAVRSLLPSGIPQGRGRGRNVERTRGGKSGQAVKKGREAISVGEGRRQSPEEGS